MNSKYGVVVAVFALSKGIYNVGVTTLYPHSIVQSRSIGVPPESVKSARGRIVAYTVGSTLRSELDIFVSPVEFPARAESGMRSHVLVAEKYSSRTISVPGGVVDDTLNVPHTVPISA
jgi:hypothetical protein